MKMKKSVERFWIVRPDSVPKKTEDEAVATWNERTPADGAICDSCLAKACP